MKRLLYTFLFAIGVTGLVTAQESVIPNPDPNAPDMKFESEVIDFGLVEYDANGIREFK
ncbi:MAG: hypothetical protein JNM96_03650, partial [Bacteroidia bacterium]|nr:hypothetical protein [Bacteroidia bacterium]